MEFVSLNHFADCMKNVSLPADLANIQNTLAAYYNISKGCGCTRNDRAAHASNSYLNLVNILTELEKLFLKAAYSNEIIIFKNGDSILGQF